MTNYDLKNVEAAFAIPVHSRQFAGDLRFPLSRRFADRFASSHSDLLRVIPTYSDQKNMKAHFSFRVFGGPPLCGRHPDKSGQNTPSPHPDFADFQALPTGHFMKCPDRSLKIKP